LRTKHAGSFMHAGAYFKQTDPEDKEEDNVFLRRPLILTVTPVMTS